MEQPLYTVNMYYSHWAGRDWVGEPDQEDGGNKGRVTQEVEEVRQVENEATSHEPYGERRLEI